MYDAGISRNVFRTGPQTDQAMTHPCSIAKTYTGDSINALAK